MDAPGLRRAGQGEAAPWHGRRSVPLRRGAHARAGDDPRVRAAPSTRCRAASTPENHADAVAIASLPDQVRGYEHLKVGGRGVPARRRPPRDSVSTEDAQRRSIGSTHVHVTVGRAPTRAAPTMPAELCISAGTTSVATSMWGSHLSDFLLTPPPTMIRSGESSATPCVEVAVDPLGPVLPRQVLTLAGARRRLRLGDVAVDLDVAELGVRHEHTVGEQARPDPRAEGEHQHHACVGPSGAEANLGEAGCVGVVDDVHVASRPPRVNSASMSMPIHDWSMFAALSTTPSRDDRREGDTDRPGPREVSDELGHDVGHRPRVAGCGVAMRRRSVRQLALDHVDRSGLHPAAADVDPEGLLHEQLRTRWSGATSRRSRWSRPARASASAPGPGRTGRAGSASPTRTTRRRTAGPG